MTTKLASSFLLIMFVTGALFPPLISGETTSHIFRRAIQSHGGRTAFLLNRELVWQAPVQLGSLRGRLVHYFKWPDKLRRDLSIEKQVEEEILPLRILQVYDGRTAWVKGSTTELREDTRLAGAMSRVAKRLLFILLRHQDEGVHLRYMGQKIVNGSSVDAVEMIEKWGNTILYFDRKSGLLSGLAFSEGITPNGKERKTKVFFSDFLSVGGLLMPHHVEEYSDGNKVGEVRYSNIIREKALQDSLFAPQL